MTFFVHRKAAYNAHNPTLLTDRAHKIIHIAWWGKVGVEMI
jgi:hypothetical protein